jgi:hypothetical protein
MMRAAGARWMGGGAGAGVEGIMRMRERMKLTDNQFKRLDAIRADIVQQRASHLAEMIELRSRVMAGEATRGALVDSITAWRKAAVAVRQQQRDRVQAILTQAQKDTLATIVGRRRAFAMGRASAMRGMMRHRMGRGGGAFMPGRGGAFQGRGGWRQGGMMQQGMRPGRMLAPGRGLGTGQGFGPPLPDSGKASGGGGSGS